MPQTQSRGTQQAQGGLAAAVRKLKDDLAVVPARFAPYTPGELYQRFLLVTPDHKGNLSSTCGEYGRALSLDVSFDFGDLILPGVTSLDVTLGARGDVLTVALLVIHRAAPKVLSGPTASAPKRWTGKTPVCFLSMSGQKQILTVTLGATFRVGNNFSTGVTTGGASPEAIGLSMDMSAQLAANAQLKGIVMHLTDPSPGWYLNGMDSALQTDFRTILGPGNKKALKQEVANWYQYILDLVAQQLSIANNPNLQTVQAELQKLNGGLNLEEQLAAMAKDLATDQIKSLVGNFVQNEPTLSAIEQLLNYASAKLDGSTSTAELIADLQKLQTLYVGYAQRSALAKTQLQQIKDQIVWYTNVLNAAKSFETTPVALPPKSGSRPGLKKPYQRLGYLSVFSFIPSAGGSASATLGADGSISGQGVGANATATAGASLTASGQLGFTSYRYQTFALSDQGIPLVSTQDTQMSYRQAQITGSVLAALQTSGELGDYGLAKNFSKSAVYNMLTYHSVQAYWQYGTALSGTAPPAGPAVALESGSGLSFGCSVSFLKLVRIARQLAGTDPAVPADQDLLTGLAKQLRVKLADLQTFFKAAQMEELAGSDLAAYTSVILESSHEFTLAATTTVPVKKRNNSFFSKSKEAQYYLPDLLNYQPVMDAIEAIKNPEAPATSALAPKLAAIRLRVRLADHSANEKTLFQLGFKVAAGLNVSLNKIQSVGNESVLDVYTHWFDPYTDSNQGNASDAYEQSVPAVALLHQ